MAFVPHEWFAEQAAADAGAENGGRNCGLDADGLPRQGSPFWDGVPPVEIGGDAGRTACGREATVHRRFCNGPYRFVWLATMYDAESDTAYGCFDLNYGSGDGGSGGSGNGSGGRWGLFPLWHVRLLGGRADASWKRPLPYADAVGHRARVSAPFTEVRRTPPHSLVGFDACPSDGGAPRTARTIEIPRRLRPCGIDSATGAPMYEYCYGGVPQDGAPVVLDTIYQSGDAGALALARRLNGSYGYAIRVCRNDGGCSLCRDRPCRGAGSTRRRRHRMAGRAGTGGNEKATGGGGRQ